MVDDRRRSPPAEAADTDIAIVGMAGRFPGAPDVDELWRRVAAGDDCLVDLDEASSPPPACPHGVLDDPDYVRRNGVLDDVEMFDAGVLRHRPRDAAIMDPQHRHFIECCWEALETSGHVPERFAGAIGVFAGCGMNTYMLNNLLTNPTLVEQVGMFLLRHTANDKDFLDDDGVVQARPARPVGQRADGVLDVARRRPPRRAEPARVRVRHGARRRRRRSRCPTGVGYMYHEGEILVARRRTAGRSTSGRRAPC